MSRRSSSRSSNSSGGGSSGATPATSTAASASNQMAAYKAQLHDILEVVDEKLLVYPLVQQVCAQTKVRASYLASGAVVFLTLFLFWGLGGRLVANAVGFIYPLYESYGSLRRKPHPGVVDEEDTQWLTYWVVYSSFTLIESLTSMLQTWIPLYHLVKIAFLVWCMAPQTRGALLIYARVIEPVLVKYEGKIDAARHHLHRSIDSFGDIVMEAGSEALDAKKKELVDEAVDSLLTRRGKGQQAEQSEGVDHEAGEEGLGEEEEEAVAVEKPAAEGEVEGEEGVAGAPGGAETEHDKDL